MSNAMSFERSGTVITVIDAPGNSELRTINSYLVAHASGLYLVDAGMDKASCWEAFIRVLQQQGYQVEDVKGIILTHHHPDHVGLVHRIRKLHPSVRVYAHPLALPYITYDKDFLNKRINFFEQLYREMDSMPDAVKQIEKFKASFIANEAFRIEGDITIIQEGDSLLDFIVLDVPGHAPDHILLYDPVRKWAIVGDLVIEHMSTNAIIEPDAKLSLIPTVTQQLSSLQRCLQLDMNLMFTGHGIVIHDPKPVIASKIAKMEQKLDKMQQLIADGYDTAGRIARLYEKDVYERQFFLVISEVIGLLTHLEQVGCVVRRKVYGIYHYAVTRRDSGVSI